MLLMLAAILYSLRLLAKRQVNKCLHVKKVNAKRREKLEKPDYNKRSNNEQDSSTDKGAVKPLQLLNTVKHQFESSSSSEISLTNLADASPKLLLQPSHRNIILHSSKPITHRIRASRMESSVPIREEKFQINKGPKTEPN